MGKIAKSASEKHEATLSPAVSNFITAATLLPLHEIPGHLTTFPALWPFPRGDVYHWIATLNHFDDILARFNSIYGLTAGPQTRAFGRQLLLEGLSPDTSNAVIPNIDNAGLDKLGFTTEGDRELVEAILDFTRLIIENCGNRSLYASSSRLNDLLNTSSLSLLESALALCLRLAQRYSASRLRLAGPYLQGIHHALLMQHFMVDLGRLENIAQPLRKTASSIKPFKDFPKSGKTDDSSLDLLATVRSDSDQKTIWMEFATVSMNLPPSSSSGSVANTSSVPSTKADAVDPASPTPMRRTISAGTPGRRFMNGQPDVEQEPTQPKHELFEIAVEQISATSTIDLLQEYLAKIPKSQQYELLQKLRIAKAIGSLEGRNAIVRIRLLAVACLANIYPEQTLQQKVLLQDAEVPRRFQLPHQLCDLLHPPGNEATGITKRLQSIVFETLEALTNHKNKAGDVSAELGVNVSHGVLSYIVRKAVAEASVDETAENVVVDRAWRDCLFTLINVLPKSTPRTTEGFLSSGLVELLVEALACRTMKAEVDFPGIVNFLDMYVYQTSNGFTALVNARGLESISSLFAYQVDTALAQEQDGNGMLAQFKTSVTDYKIPFFKQQTLRALIRFLNHVMSFSGAPFDRILRNLIESTQLLQGLRVVMVHPAIFGSNVWSGAVTLFSSFIHNEPTSYAAIAEAGLTKAFLETITQHPLDQQSQGVPAFESQEDSINRLLSSNTTQVHDRNSGNTYSDGVLASAECISAIPQAFSAICLNENGMQQFEASGALKVFFAAFESNAHVKALSNAPGTEVERLGQDIDELARHHPNLKTSIVELTSKTIGRIAKSSRSSLVVEALGPKLYHATQDGQVSINGGIKVSTPAIPNAPGSSESGGAPTNGGTLTQSEDVEMSDAQIQLSQGQSSVQPTLVPHENLQGRIATAADSVTVCSRFLLGFFGNSSMCAAFAEADGIEDLLDLAYAPSLPWDFHRHNHGAPNRIIRSIYALVEHKPHLVLPSVVKRTQNALKVLQPFLDHDENSSYFSPFVLSTEPVDETHWRVEGGQAASCLRALLAVQTSCYLLALVFWSHSNRTSSNPFSSVNLADMYAQTITVLGTLQRKCVWDAGLLRQAREARGKPGASTQPSVTAAAPSNVESGQTESTTNNSHEILTNATPVSSEMEDRNYGPVAYLLENLPQAISKFSSAIGRAVLTRTRRLPSDPYQKQNIRLIGDTLAEALMDQLKYCISHEDGGDKLRESYSKDIIVRLKDVLIDPKPDSERPLPQVLTVVVQPFKAKGGFRLLGTLAQASFNEIVIRSASDTLEKPGSTELTEVFNSILQFFSQMSNNQFVLDALQTHALNPRADQRDKLDFLSPNQFLVEIRAEISEVILPIWNSSDIPRSQDDAVSRLAMILQNILEAQGETGALKRTDFVPSRPMPARAVWEMKSHKDFERLLEKGFVPDLAREALYRCNDVYVSAQEYCSAYKKNPSLARYPPPQEDMAVSLESKASQSPQNTQRENQEESGDLSGSSARLDDAYATLTALRDPLRATAESVLRDHLSNSTPTDLSSHGALPHPPQNEAGRLRASDCPDLITVDDLDVTRSEIRTQLMDRSLTLLERFQTLTFEIAELLIGAALKAPHPVETRQEFTSTLVESLISYQGAENLKENGKKVAAVAHLLGVVLQEKEFFEAAQDELKDSFSALLGFLIVPADEKPEEAAPWIPQTMLILEHILAEDAQPRQIQWEPPSPGQTSTSQVIAKLPEPFIPLEDKIDLFDHVLELLPRVGKNAALGNALVRILVVLTRSRHICGRMGQKRCLQRLFLMVKQLSGTKDNKFQNRVLLILRHVIEDDDTIRQIMRADIRTTFEKQSPSRPLETTTYTRNLYYLVLRSPEIFVEITNELLELKEFNRSQSPQQLQLKKVEKRSDDALMTGLPQNEVSPESSSQPAGTTATFQIPNPTEKGKTTDSKSSNVDYSEGVVHYLLSELLSYKDVDDKETQPQTQNLSEQRSHERATDVEMSSSESEASHDASVSTAPLEGKKAEDKIQFDPEDHIIYMYRTFILQCLTELLQSYNKTKLEFINYSRKIDGQSATPSKPRSGALNYFLNSLVPTGFIKHAEQITEKKKSVVSGWAISVLVALCFRTSEKDPTKRRDTTDAPEDEPDLLLVRRFVVEHALRAYKDATASMESVEMKYSRLLSMADLFDRMLAGRPADTAGYRRSNETPDDSLVPTQKQIAKLMFDKGVITALTSSVSEIDMKIPSAGRVVKYILRPLKLLTHTAVEVSLTSDVSTTPGQTDEDEISSATSVSEAANEREDTPDFYRNSTLGMFEPGREEEPSSGSSEGDEDEDMYGDEYGDDMDYDEEEAHDDDVVSDEDMEIDGMEGMGPIEGMPGDIGMSVQIDIDEDDDDDSDDDDDADDMESDEDDDDDVEDEYEGNDEAQDEVEIIDEMVAEGGAGLRGRDVDEGDWQDEDDDLGFPHDGTEVVLDLMGNGPQRVVGGAASESDEDGEDGEHYGGAGAVNPMMGEGGGMEIEDDAAIDEGSEHDDEDDEEDLDDDGLVYGGSTYENFDDDDNALPFFMQGMPAPRRSIRNHFPTLLRAGEMPGYRSHRHRPDRPARADDDGLNPLLDRLRDPVTETPSQQQGNRTMPPWFHATVDLLGGERGFPGTGPASEAMDALRTIAANHPVIPDIQQLIDAVGHRGHHVHSHHHPPHLHSIQFTVGSGGPRGLQRVMEIHPHHQNPQSRATSSDPVSAISFTPTGTVERWQEEVRMIFGPLYTEKSQRVINSILQLLVPPAIEADIKRKLVEAEEKAKKAEEDRVRREAERAAQRQKEEEEREAARKAEEEAAAAREQAAEQSGTAANADPIADAMEGVETAEDQVPTASAPIQEVPRVITYIRGRELDITRLGIDIDFLHALPEDMREEVIMGRYAEQRSVAAAAGDEPTALDRAFLDALPADIRQDLEADEAQLRRRRERDEARRRSQGAGAPARAEEIDPASFMATLDPILRRTILADVADADEDTLAQLPPDLAAEARALGGRHRQRAMDPTQLMADIERATDFRGRRNADYLQHTTDPKTPRRPIVQMLDKAGIATLLRLMFVTLNGSSRNCLNRILRNACGNHQTRGEVVSGLLSILQDGTADIAAMERNFANLTLRAKQVQPNKTPQSVKRTNSMPSFDSGEVSPLVVVGYCLSALIFLTNSIARLPSFFLTEHELFGSAKAKAKAKGKGKDTKAGHYPINALLSLLERDVLVDNSQVMESLASLLQIVTQPLNSLVKKDKEEETVSVSAPAESSAQSAVATQQTPTDPSTTNSGQVTSQELSTTNISAAETSSSTNETTVTTKDENKVEEPKRTLTAPEIPEEHLRIIVNIFTARECSGKTFRDTLSTISNLSAVPRARQIFGQELIDRARQLGKSIQLDLAKLIKALQGAETEMEAQSLALANFSPAGSDQAKLSRILTALDYLFDARSAENKDMSSTESNSLRETGEGLLTALYEDPTFNSLWYQLSACLSATQQAEKYFLNVATILLPLIESLMVVCKKLSPMEARSLMMTKSSVPTTPAPEPALKTIFFSFTNKHKKILNDLVRNNPKLMSGTFSVLVKNSSVLEFDNKRNYFNRKLHHRTVDMRTYPHPPLQLNVVRDQVFRDSFKSLHFKKPEEIKYGKLNIRFVGEEGVDAGGVTREWFQVLARQMFNADYALFLPVASDRTTFHPNPLSTINDEHLRYFHFIGRIIGKALYENRVLDCHFSRAMYKRMLGKSVTMKDMETIDLDYTKSLQWMLENDITDVITETFSVTKDNFGIMEMIDLVENGRNIPVTEENKHEYVRLIIADRLTGSIAEQLEHFLRGFHDIVPADLISIFDEGELELLISGMPEVDVDDWKNNTEYHNYNTTSPQIQWFWRAVRSFDKEERAKLLQFVTGTGKVPLNGFKELEGMNGFTRFSIHRDYGNKERLPSSHTCFNQLDLPEYDSYEALRKALCTAITTGGEYFGFA